jgi:hypothetical protein
LITPKREDGLIHICGLFRKFIPEQPLTFPRLQRVTHADLSPYFNRFREEYLGNCETANQLLRSTTITELSVQSKRIYGMVNNHKVDILLGLTDSLCGIDASTCTCNSNNNHCDHVKAFMLYINLVWRNELDLTDLNLERAIFVIDNLHNIGVQVSVFFLILIICRQKINMSCLKKSWGLMKKW